MKSIEIGTVLEQIKGIEEYGFNYVGEKFTVDKITAQGVICKGNGVGFGASWEEINKHFKVVSPVNTVIEKDDYKVILNDRVTVVILSDGSKGIAKCLPEDEYDQQKGIEIAFTKAQIKSLNKKLKKLSK